MDQAPAPTEKVEQTLAESTSAPEPATPATPSPTPKKDQPPPGPTPDRSFRLNLSGQAQAALTRGKLMDDATRTKLKAQADAQAARDQKKAAQEQKRKKIETSKRRALESDKLLGDAIKRLVETDSTRAGAHREGQRLIEQADRRVAESQQHLDAAHAAVAKANEALARAIFEHGRTLTAAQEARVKWSPEHADASYNDARISAQAAVVENELAWHDVSKPFRKEKRDRAIRRSARELGLTVETDDRAEQSAESPETDHDELEPELVVEGTFVVPGAVEALMAERQSMEELVDFQKAGTSEDNATP